MGRDKFAAMAARNAAETTTTGGSMGEGTTAPSAEAAPVAAAPRRDKLAAMASRNAAAAAAAPVVPASSGGRGNKFAAMAANATTTAATTTEEQSHISDQILENQKENYKQQIKERLNKRKKILEQLDRAEDLTCKLLEIAHQTTKALEDLSCAPHISELSRTYRETLREIHPLLSTDTEDLVQPYQNHSMETKQSMYAARVEMRLAKERTNVLKIMTELEKQVQGEHTLGHQAIADSDSKKRPREQEA